MLFVRAGGKVYAVDRETMEVTELFGRRGRQAGQFVAAHSAALDSQGNLYVSETLAGSRIQKFVRKETLAAPGVVNDGGDGLLRAPRPPCPSGPSCSSASRP